MSSFNSDDQHVDQEMISFFIKLQTKPQKTILIWNYTVRLIEQEKAAVHKDFWGGKFMIEKLNYTVKEGSP